MSPNYNPTQEKRCPRCDHYFPSWQPIHLFCLARRVRYFIAGPLLLLLGLLCIRSYTFLQLWQLERSNQLSSSSENLPDPPAAPVPTAVSTPKQPTPRSTLTTTALAVLQENFTDSDMEWEEFLNEDSAAQIGAGRLIITIYENRETTNWLAWSELYDQTFSSFSLEVDTKLIFS
nr:hypothetical protein [Ardenticatenales bacterium]